MTTVLVFVALLLGFMAPGLWKQRVTCRRADAPAAASDDGLGSDTGGDGGGGCGGD